MRRVQDLDGVRRPSRYEVLSSDGRARLRNWPLKACYRGVAMQQIAEWLKDLQAEENKMSEAAAAQTGAPPPEAHIAEILLSQLAPRLVHLAARSLLQLQLY
jgi:hypothetical protein